MTGPPDLDACAREPIHIPGSIQPHGVLLVVDPAESSMSATCRCRSSRCSTRATGSRWT